MANRRSKFFCRWAGFTLVELILVLMVLTVMVSIVAPSLRGFGVGRQSSDAATQILSLAQWARAQAGVILARAQRSNSATASSMWPCAAQSGSKDGDLLGIRMYSTKVGTISSPQH